MAEYSRIARGNFQSNGVTQPIYLPFAPDVVKFWNYSVYADPDQHEIAEAYWSSQMGEGTALVKLFNATPVLTTGLVLSNGITVFSAGQLLQYGPKVQITSIAKSALSTGGTTINFASNPFSEGDVIIFEGLYQSPTTGMAQLCGMTFEVTSATSTSIVIDYNTNGSNFTSLSGSPAGAYARKVLYPYLYEPGVSYIQSIGVTGSVITVTTTSPHNFVLGQTIGFRIPPAFGTVELNALPNVQIPGSPKYYYVSRVTSNSQFQIQVAGASAFTAFNTNQPIASVPGLDFPQVYAVGDVNTGGIQYTGGALYPSPVFPTYQNGVATIGGPAIQGAFVNNTYSGFAIGTGAAASDEDSVLVGQAGDQIYWEAYLMDLTVQ